MELLMANFLGIREAQIELNGVVLVAGANGAGKSSILRAAAACATGSIIPVVLPSGKEMVARGATKSMVYAGQKKAQATLVNGDQSITITWPLNKIIGGIPVSTNPLSAGMIEWMAMPPADRSRVLANAMAKAGIETEPTKQDLIDAMTQVGVGDPQYTDYVWSLKLAKGWESAAKEISDKWTEVKGLWSGATGEAYGSDKAKTWCPRGWTDDLTHQNEESLSQWIKDAESALEDGITRKAVDSEVIRAAMELANQPKINITENDARLSALNAEIKALDDSVKAGVNTATIQMHRNNIQVLTDKLAVATKELAALDDQLLSPKKLPTIPDISNLNAYCPACQAGLFIDSSTEGISVQLASTTSIDVLEAARSARVEAEAEEKRRNKANDETRKLINTAKAGVVKLKAEMADQMSSLAAAIQEAEYDVAEKKRVLLDKVSAVRNAIFTDDHHNRSIDKAQANLATLMANKDNTVTEAEIQILRAGVETAKQRLSAFTAKTAADSAADRAARLAKIRDVLAPEGLRSTKLQHAMDHITVMIGGICADADWPPVLLDSDLNLYFDSRPHVLLSRSEQFRCQVVMQMVMAKLTNSQLILIDGADILDATGRFGLIKMLKASGITTMVTMTTKHDYAEAVAKLFNSTFWVDGGIVSMINNRRKEAS
ncbi:MAG: AAA family ATPase [Magnetococcales bacterium]|nr:AAA family ATPase [Magnetococcales bacterium]